MRCWIVWNEEMTEGVVFKDENTADGLLEGSGDSDLAEAFYNLNSGSTLTKDAVDLDMRLN